MHRVVVTLMGCIAGALLAARVAAQEDTGPPPGYIPLFNEAQIENASPETRERMRETERINREGWIERQKSLPTAGGGSGEDPSERASEPVTDLTRSAGRRKIYRWVDADGRVNFGDNPPGPAAQEVKIQGADPPGSGRSSADITPASRPRPGSGSD